MLVDIFVIDGMGGGLGKAAIEHILQAGISCNIVAVGTNAAATAAMLKAGAHNCATGENAVKYNAKNADVIIGPLGVVFADSMFGEISPKMAKAIVKSNAYKILIPVSKCNATVLGSGDKTLGEHFNEMVSILKSMNI